MKMNKLLLFFTIFFFFSFSVFGSNYYWVGGSGSWSDINHWRTTSGGAGIPGVVPGPTDDVFFDANSGFTSSSKTISLNVPATCRNITFASIATPPTLNYSGNISANSLNIYGSSVWQSGMTLSSIIVNYQNAGASTITSNGVAFYTVYFLGTGSVSLVDNLKTTASLYINAGTFNTNNKTVDIRQYFYANQGPVARTINLGSSDIYCGYYNVYMNSEYITLNAGTSTIHLNPSENVSPSFQAYQGQVYYNIVFENLAGTSGTLNSGGTLANNVKFNRVEFKEDGSIYGFNTFKDLIFSPGKSYLLQNGNTNASYNYTQTITGSLIAESECVGWLPIQSSSVGVAANISMPAGAVVKMSGAALTDIKATGGATFTANNSIDNGGNSGWTFISSTSPDLYWVGGEGIWNDTDHWSLTSGGLGGACVPSPTSNVFFDANSGFTPLSKKVTVNGAAYCRNITFAGSDTPPEVTYLGTPSLNIYGSSVWQSGMTFSMYTINYRNTGIPKTITSNGVKTGGTSTGYVYLYETSSISLVDDFNMANSHLYLYAGTFNTNNKRVDTYVFTANQGTASRTLNLGSSDVYVYYYLYTGTTNLTLNAGTSHIHFNGANCQLSSIQGQVFYDVTFENPATSVSLSGGSSINNTRFNRVEFRGNGSINGYNTFKELILAPAKNYTLQSYLNQSYTQTVTGLFSVESACLGWATLRASVLNVPASFSMPAGATMNVSGVMMRDIKAIGGATFTASNSIDEGGNTGWNFTTSTSPDLYWVGGTGLWNEASHWSFTSGGAGGACVPSPNNNVFFDAGSGFTSSSKTVTIDGTSYCRNITFAGTAIPPTVNYTSSVNTVSLNIYGSSVWQSGMTMSPYYINYQNTGTPKTITSNGVKTGNGNLYMYETTSISLVDDFKAPSSWYLLAGTFNTNNNRVDAAGYVYANNGTNFKTFNLGSSDFYIYYSLLANNQYSIINAGTSHIHFTSLSCTLSTYTGQVYNNVTFEYANPSTVSIQSAGTSVGKEVQYNRVEFKGSVGSLSGHNIFNQLFLTAGGTYTLSEGTDIQTVKERLTMSGNTCQVLFVKSSSSGKQANLNLLGGRSDFNFVNIKDINATGGLTLRFGDKSTVAGQNNTNITYDAYNSGEFNGFPSDWTCHFIDTDVPASYTLTADGFFGTEYTEYVWTKIGDPNFTGTIGTGSSIDLRTFGYGTYRVQVKYNATCIVTGTVLVVKRTDSVDGGVQPSKVCLLPVNTLANISVNGENIKWYATAVSAAALPLTTVITNGTTYYVTQTKNSCESGRIPITIKISDCTNVYVNPNLRMRVPM